MVTAISLPNCKSILIRQLIARFVLNDSVLEVSEDECSDVKFTAGALKVVAKNRAQNSDLSIENVTTVDVADCGAAYRFLTALLAVTPGRWLLTGTDKLRQRPIAELISALREIGAEIDSLPDGLHIVGHPLHAESMSVDCSRSSQFASAILLISSKIGLKTLQLESAEVGSVPYIQMTRLCLPNWVEMPQLSAPPSSLGTLGDWSAALFWYAYLALHPSRSLLLENLSLTSAQGDSVIAEWFESMGVRSEQVENGVRISTFQKSKNNTFVFDVANHPDVVPVMAMLAALMPADILFRHTRNLKFKETDRIDALLAQLAPMAYIEYCNGDLRVVGKNRSDWTNQPAVWDTYQDHRMAMALLLLEEPERLNDADCLRKSYPHLLNQCLSLK